MNLQKENKYVIIAAAGLGMRMNSTLPKQFIPLAGVPIVVRTIAAFLHVFEDIEFVIALPEEEFPRWEKIRRKFLRHVPVRHTKGGATRFHSVKNGLKLIKEEGLIAVQDACRPFPNEKLVTACFETAAEKGNAVPAVELTDSLRELMNEGNKHRSRQKFRAIQTPQCFRSGMLKKAYQQTFLESFTDDAAVVEAAGFKIYLLPGDEYNFKITTRLDLMLAERLVQENLL